jgi:hypothetical protein
MLSPGDVCAIVPAYNEEKSIVSVVAELRLALPAAEVIVVSDGSTDQTAELALGAGAVVVSLPVNLGIGGAVQAGYRYALRSGFRIAVQVDGDGQHDPGELSRILDPIMSNEVDLVIGSRWLGRGDYVGSRARRIGMRVLTVLVRWRTGLWFTDTTSGFRAAGPRALAAFARSYPADYPEVEAIVIGARMGLRMMEVPVRMNARKYGRSTIGGWRSLYYMARVAMALVVGGASGAIGS